MSGVGFLGAGVIFKDGFTVSGLTTAGIIWLAAAMGTSIGFGEYYMAATFMGAALLTIFILTSVVNALFAPKKTKQLQFELSKDNIIQKTSIITSLTGQGIRVEEKKIESGAGSVTVSLEVILKEGHYEWLQQYMLEHEQGISFSL